MYVNNLLAQPPFAMLSNFNRAAILGLLFFVFLFDLQTLRFCKHQRTQRPSCVPVSMRSLLFVIMHDVNESVGGSFQNTNGNLKLILFYFYLRQTKKNSQSNEKSKSKNIQRPCLVQITIFFCCHLAIV